MTQLKAINTTTYITSDRLDLRYQPLGFLLVQSLDRTQDHVHNLPVQMPIQHWGPYHRHSGRWTAASLFLLARDGGPYPGFEEWTLIRCIRARRSAAWSTWKDEWPRLYECSLWTAENSCHHRVKPISTVGEPGQDRYDGIRRKTYRLC